jgi:pyruvate,water dikinase
MIKFFNNLSKKDTDIAGGKGASLGEMTQAGIPVPPGFVVLAKAFEKFIKETDISIELDAMWDRLNIKNTDNLEENSTIIRDVIIKKEFPEEIKKEILDAFNKLNSQYVAVRSSATAEDSKQDAWAGQLETCLYVNKENLLENVKKCWASLFTPRALFYRIERGFRKKNVSVAVVIQKMVNSEIAGVCFTVHPVTQNKDQMIIEACYGLGEALVSGTITPDSYVIEKSTLNIIDINISDQEKQITRGDKETQEIDLDPGLRSRQKLTEQQIKELTSLCLEIERHYGCPQDIEWAIEKDKIYIVQSRPVTTLD